LYLYVVVFMTKQH